MSFSQCLRWSAKVAASFSIALFRALLVGIKVFSLRCQPCFTCERRHRCVKDPQQQEAASLQSRDGKLLHSDIKSNALTFGSKERPL